MKLEGIHHITAITADATGNLAFYAEVLGLRLVAKSINQDDSNPTYHLFYADEKATPGAELTFFEYPGLPRGRSGAGMVHRITWRVQSEEALQFWKDRLEHHGIPTRSGSNSLQFDDPEGLGLELLVVSRSDAKLTAHHPDISEELALQGFEGVRAYCDHPQESRGLLEGALSFQPIGEQVWEARADLRGGTYTYDPSPERHGLQGAGTVHHVAWRARSDEEHPRWRDRLAAAGASPTPVIDRYYFRSIYFREPGGILFEIASPGPGFTRDTPLPDLGKTIALPPWLEPQRAQIERQLTPLANPREAWSPT